MADAGSVEGTISIDASGATSGAAEANKAFDFVGVGALKAEQTVTKAGEDQTIGYEKTSQSVQKSAGSTGKAWLDVGGIIDPPPTPCSWRAAETAMRSEQHLGIEKSLSIYFINMYLSYHRILFLDG